MSYTITVPDKPEALKAAAEFFSRLAGVNVIVSSGGGTPTGPYQITEDPLERRTLIGDAPVPDVVSFIPAPSVSNAPVVAPEPPVPPVVSTVEEPVVVVPDAASVFGVSLPSAIPADLDANGLPWDGRIHASTRTKIADGSWKKRKRPAEQYSEPDWTAYIQGIEQKLQSVMALPAVPVAPTVPGAGATGTIASFAQLNVAITSNAVPFERVTEAINQVGLQAYPLLAARPDLVPAVAAILFP
jgi:hypothetical protein